MRLLESRSVAFLAALMVMFMLVPMVQAVPPIQEVSTGTQTWAVQIQLIEAHEFNQSHTFNAHIFNSSNGYPIYTGASCYFDLYGPNGEHFARMTDNTADTFDYSFTPTASNFSQTGEYAYRIQCNSSTQGGSTIETFMITPNGLTPKGDIFNVFVNVFFIIIIIGLTFAIMWNLAALATASSTINLVATSLGFYFAYTILYFLSKEYMMGSFISNTLTTLYTPITYAAVVVPFIGLFVTIFYNVLIKKQHNGVKI